MGRLFGTNGVRGVANVEMTPEFALGMGRAIGRFMGGRVAVATDSRTSGAMISSAVSAGLMAVGAEVLELGLLPTPALQLFVKGRDDVMGGVMITASHNPPEFNGIKCVDHDGTEMHRTKEEAIEAIFFDDSAGHEGWDGVGTSRRVSGAGDEYIAAVASHVDVDSIRDAGLVVVVDCANGAASVTAPLLMDVLGVRAVTLNANPQGKFPGHPSEPTEDNLHDLMSMVRGVGADIGIAHDGDADRTIFVDDRGRYVYGDKSLAIVSRSMVAESGGVVVTPVSTSSCVEDVVKDVGGTVDYTRVGSPIVARRMMDIGAVFGGEENGGLIFPEHQHCRDGAMTAAKMLEIVATDGPLSELVDSVPMYHLDKRKIPCPDDVKQSLLEGAAERLEGRDVDLTDGIKVRFDGGWTLVRPSGTEPIFRIFTEAGDDDTAKRMGDEMQGLLESLMRRS